MNILQKVWELDLAYLDTLAKRINTSWGYLFHNENQPAYYDANHAHIIEIPAHPELVIEEVLHFYKERNLIPRFYIYDFENQASLIEKLSSDHFQVESLVSPVQLWNKSISEHKENGGVSIERVTTENFQEVLEIECSIQEFGGKEVREKAFAEEFKHPSFTHYLLRYDGVACSTACLFQQDDQVRLESVATIEEYRGKGLIGELVSYLQAEVRNRGLENFWVFPINERVEKVYARYGFDTVAKYTTGHAFLSGKSIKEIQGS
ncbi:MAG TPA: GNAT family N-acetyltransferase [Neobacillus sp.]